MSFHLIGLGKLLNAMYATDPQRTTLLRTDIRNGIKKASGSSTDKGGDFYGPFWADAKRDVAGELDLRVVTPQRAEGNKTRERLYPMLCDGFLLWWEEKRRLRNVPFTVINNSVKARYEAPSLGTVKVENTLRSRSARMATASSICAQQPNNASKGICREDAMKRYAHCRRTGEVGTPYLFTVGGMRRR